MIELLGITTSRRYQPQFRGVTATFPRRSRVGILGAAGSGKSTLLRMIAGTELPSGGYIRRTGQISWPLGLAAALHPDLSGAENVAHLSRIHGMDADFAVAFCSTFSGLTTDEPLRTYTPGMRARLAFAFSYAAPFDVFLADETTGAGDEEFRARCDAMLDTRLTQAGLVMTSRRAATLSRYCKSFFALARGALIACPDAETADAVMRTAQQESKEFAHV